MKNGDKIFKRVIIFASVISTAVIFLYIFQFAKEPLSTDNGVWGQFGDYVGGTLNPVFGFLSLVILLYVLRQNERALQMSKEELELTRQELKNSATALAEQSETLKVQRFEQTFFSLLDLYSKNLAELTFFQKTDKKAIALFYDHLKSYSKSEIIDGYSGKIIKTEMLYGDLNGFDKQFEAFAKAYNEYLAHYFRIIYHILKFVDAANIINKQTYANLLRAQLSTAEILLLFYNGISSFGREKMLPLMFRYDLLQHIDYGLLYNREVDLQIFEELRENIELAQTVKERLSENEKPIKMSLDEL